MATVTGITTSTSSTGWHPDQTFYAPVDFIPQALVMQTSTIAGDVDGDQVVCRVPYVRDSGDSGNGATPKAELELLDDDRPELAEVEIRTTKVGRLATISTEQFEKEGTAAQLAASFCRDIARRADVALLGGITDRIVGLRDLPGATEAASPVVGNLDALVDLLAELEVAGATPTAILLDPRSWAVLRKLKTGDGRNDTLLASGATDTAPRLLDLPVLRSRFMPPGDGLVIDKNELISAVGQVRVAQSEHAQFNRDGVVLRATFRFGWAVPRPDRIGRFTVGTGKK